MKLISWQSANTGLLTDMTSSCLCQIEKGRFLGGVKGALSFFDESY